MKRVALVSFSNNYDMQEYLYSLQQELKLLGVNASTFGSNVLRARKTIECDNHLFRVPARPGVEIRTFSILLIFRIALALRGFDMVYFISSHSWHAILAKLLRKRAIVVHSIHDPFPHENEKVTLSVALYNKYIVKNVDCVVLHNTGMEAQFRERYSFRGPLCVYPLWRNWLSFRSPPNGKRVLFFGRVNPYKGLETVLYLAHQLPELEFMVVGKFGAEMKSHKACLQEMTNVKVHDGYVDEAELDSCFHGSDVVILPYTSATQSGVVVEAYRHSRPVIAYDVGALREQISHRVSGYLVERGSATEFRDVIREFFALGNESRLELSANAYEFGRKLFSPMEAAKAISQMVVEGVGGHEI